MNSIILHGYTDPSVTTTGQIEAAKQAALREAETIQSIGNAMEAQLAGETLVALRGLLKACEDSRKQVKEPVLTLGRKIDAVAAAFSADLESAAKRISRLVAAFQLEEQRKAQEAAMARQKELERIEREKRELEAAAKAEADKKLREAASAQEAQREIDRVQAESIRRREELDRQAAAAPVAAPVKKLDGITVRKVKKFEVTDIRALYAARPNLVELRPVASQINAAIAAGETEIPGLRVWEEAQAIAR